MALQRLRQRISHLNSRITGFTEHCLSLRAIELAIPNGHRMLTGQIRRQNATCLAKPINAIVIISSRGQTRAGIKPRQQTAVAPCVTGRSQPGAVSIKLKRHATRLSDARR